MNFIRRNNILNKKLGFSLLELVLAVAIFSLGSVAMATLLIDSNISTKLSQERIEALSYAKETLGAVRSIRNGSWNVLVDGKYGLSNTSGWAFIGAESDLIGGKYTRSVDVSTGDDENTKNIQVTISWDLTPSRVASVVLNTILTNWVVPPAVAENGSNIPTDDLVSYWSFKGNANDSTTNHNNGTVYGATLTTGVKGEADTAYVFNGTSNYLLATLTGFNTAASHSVLFWVYVTSTSQAGAEQFELSNGSDCAGGPGSYVGGISAGMMEWDRCGDGSIRTPIDTLANLSGAWHQIGYTYTGTSLTSYLDGQPVATRTLTFASITSPKLNFFSNRIGTQNFAGKLDEARVYSRVLLPLEVTNIYDEEKP